MCKSNAFVPPVGFGLTLHVTWGGCSLKLLGFQAHPHSRSHKWQGGFRLPRWQPEGLFLFNIATLLNSVLNTAFNLVVSYAFRLMSWKTNLLTVFQIQLHFPSTKRNVAMIDNWTHFISPSLLQFLFNECIFLKSISNKTCLVHCLRNEHKGPCGIQLQWINEQC